jgi:hypothetical protein
MRIFTEYKGAHRFPVSLYVNYKRLYSGVSQLASAGLSGSAPIAIGGGSVSDIFAEQDRASAMALYTLGPLLGEFSVALISDWNIDQVMV